MEKKNTEDHSEIVGRLLDDETKTVEERLLLARGLLILRERQLAELMNTTDTSRPWQRAK